MTCEADCAENGKSVWRNWLYITFAALLTIVAISFAVIRCVQNKKKRKNVLVQSAQVQNPVYHVGPSHIPQQQSVPVGWSLPAHEYGTVPPAYDQIHLQSAPPAYTPS